MSDLDADASSPPETSTTEVVVAAARLAPPVDESNTSSAPTPPANVFISFAPPPQPPPSDVQRTDGYVKPTPAISTLPLPTVEAEVEKEDDTNVSTGAVDGKRRLSQEPQTTDPINTEDTVLTIHSNYDTYDYNGQLSEDSDTSDPGIPSPTTVWPCDACSYHNAIDVTNCAICNNVHLQHGQWTCKACTFVQDSSSMRCSICNTPREDLSTVQLGVRRHSLQLMPSNQVPMTGLMAALDDQGPTLFRQFSHELPKKINHFVQNPTSTPSTSTFFCDICMENQPMSKKCSLCCPHEFCVDCMEGYISLEISEARCMNIRCPGDGVDGCTAPFSKRDIKEIVDEKTYTKFERFLKLKSNSNLVECPTCNQMQKGSRLRPTIMCERKECGKEFCFIHSNAHVGKSCREYENENREKFRQDRAYLSKTSIRCPNICCRVPIYKSEGCNHMTCANCGSNFCYLCGGYYLGGLHYENNNCLGCPDMQFTNHALPNERNTWSRFFFRCLLTPFVLILCSCPIACLLCILTTIEALWLGIVLALMPCLATIKTIMLCDASYTDDVHREFNQAVCAGPIGCSILYRQMGCGCCNCCVGQNSLFDLDP